MWFFHAPGSGVWLNVGRTLVIDGSDAVLQQKIHKALILGYRRHIDPLLEDLRNRTGAENVTTLDDYDSVQFRLYSFSASWGGQRFTEIVMLKWGNEMSYVSQHITHVRCGLHPDLRPCNEAEAAMRVHGQTCRRNLHDDAAARLALEWYNCSEDPAWRRAS